MNLEALLEPIQPKHVRTCKVQRTIESLEEPYKTALKNLCEVGADDGGASPNQASAKIREAGLEISQHSIWRHRIGSCPCRSLNND